MAPEHAGRLLRPKKKRARMSRRLKPRHTKFEQLEPGFKPLKGRKTRAGRLARVKVCKEGF